MIENSVIRDCRRHPQRLAGQASLAEEGSRPEERDDRLFALFGQDRQLDLPSLGEEHSVRRVTLREDHLAVAPRDA
jgi:hypothetical protein